MVFGPMEHVLWDAVLAEHPYDIETTARQLSELLWSALTPADVDVAALMQFRYEVDQASRKLEAQDKIELTPPGYVPKKRA